MEHGPVHEVLSKLQLCHGRLLTAARPQGVTGDGASTGPPKPRCEPPDGQGHPNNASDDSAAAVETAMYLVRQHLDCARGAAAAVSAAASCSSQPSGAAGPSSASKLSCIEQEFAASASALVSLADTLVAAKGLSDHDRATTAAEVQPIVTHVAQSLAQVAQRMALRAAAEAQVAAAAGDADAAMHGAVRAQDHIAAAIWAARLGGVQGTREMAIVLRAATEALDAALLLQQRQRVEAAAGAATADAGGEAVCTAACVPPTHIQSAGLPAESSDAMAGNCVAVEVADAAAAAAAAGGPDAGTGMATPATIMAAYNDCKAAGMASHSDAAMVTTAAGDSHSASTAVAPGAVVVMVADNSDAVGTLAALGTGVAMSMDNAKASTAATPGAVTVAAADSRSASTAAVSNAAAVMVAGGPDSGTAANTDATTVDSTGTSMIARGGAAVATGASRAGGRSGSSSSSKHSGSSSHRMSEGSTHTQGHAGRQLPPCRPAATPAASGDVQSARRVLSSLVALGREAAADGTLPAAALARAAEAWKEAVSTRIHRAWVSASTAAWADPRSRRDLVIALSHIVRQMLVYITAADTLSLRKCLDVFVALRLSLEESILDRQLARAGRLPEAAAAVVQLLVRTDLVECLARLLAAVQAAAGEGALPSETAAAAAAGPSAAAAGADTAVAPVGVTVSAVGVDADPAAEDNDALVHATLLISVSNAIANLVLVSGSASAFRAHPDAPATLRQLHSAMLHSRAMEHVARSVVLHWSRVAALQEPGGMPGTGVGRDSTCPQERVENSADKRAAAARIQAAVAHVEAAAAALTGVLSASLSDDAATAVWARVVMSGPCVQYFLLLHAVSQLCTADGGSDYGLPCGARLPAMEHGRAEVEGGEAGGGSGVGLSCLLMAISFRWWARNGVRLGGSARPFSDRVLRAVCERAVAAALASTCWDERVAVGEGGLAAVRPFSPPEDALFMALSALECAMALARDNGGDFRSLWVPMVQAANAALHIPPSPGRADDGGALRLLVSMPRPPLSAALQDTGTLPSQPWPELAPALAAGYVPALERTIRRKAHLADKGGLLAVLEGIGPLLLDVRGLAALMAYSEPTSMAALLATCAKVVVAAAKAAARDPSACSKLLQLRLALSDAVIVKWDGRGAGTADVLWWRRDGSSRASTSNQAPMPPIHQLLLLTTFAATRWLSTLCSSWDLTSSALHRFSVLHGWIPTLCKAFLFCTHLGAAGGSRGADGGAPAASAAAAANDDTLQQREEAASWERLLVGTLDLPRLLPGVVQDVANKDDDREAWRGLASHVLYLLVHLMAVCPRLGREVARARVGAGPGRRAVELLQWLRDMQPAPGGEKDARAQRRYLDLAAAVVRGAEPSEEDRLYLLGIDGVAARLGALLPPPCVAAAMLGLPLCANPGCTNLEGDSEAGLMVRRGGGAGGSGSNCVSYCSRACRLEHTRADRQAARG